MVSKQRFVSSYTQPVLPHNRMERSVPASMEARGQAWEDTWHKPKVALLSRLVVYLFYGCQNGRVDAKFDVFYT